jgi:hypothetical protein
MFEVILLLGRFCCTTSNGVTLIKTRQSVTKQFGRKSAIGENKSQLKHTKLIHSTVIFAQVSKNRATDSPARSCKDQTGND